MRSFLSAILAWSVTFTLVACVLFLSLCAFFLTCIPTCLVLIWRWGEFSPSGIDTKLLELEQSRLKSHGIPPLKWQSGMRYIEASGPVEGCGVIVLLHGVGGSSLSFVHLIKELCTTHTVIAIDLPGFGRSLGGDGDSVSTICSHLELFFQLRDLQEFDLIGHSFGGYIAAHYKSLFPARVKSLVLVAPVGIFQALGVYGSHWGLFFKYYGPNFPVYYGRWGMILASLMLKDPHDWMLLGNPLSNGHQLLAGMIGLRFLGVYWKYPIYHWVTPTALVFGENDTISPPFPKHLMLGTEWMVVSDKGHCPFDDAWGSLQVATCIRGLEFNNRDSKPIGVLNDKEYVSSFHPGETQAMLDQMYRDLEIKA